MYLDRPTPEIIDTRGRQQEAEEDEELCREYCMGRPGGFSALGHQFFST